MEQKYTLGVIGGGVMAQAIVKNAIATRFLLPCQISVSEPNADKRVILTEMGVHLSENNRSLSQQCRYLLLAVKPQVFSCVAQELCDLNLPVMISIMAGISKEKILFSLRSSNFHASRSLNVARVMPNLACSLGAGMSAIDASTLSEDDKKFVFGLFSSAGMAAEVQEDQLAAVTGISGSGPAYVFLFIKSLIDAGIKHGLSKEESEIFVLQTLKGSLKMAENSELSLNELISAVSSKGGTTVAALDSFRKDEFQDIVERAVAAAVKRAKELSQ